MMLDSAISFRIISRAEMTDLFREIPAGITVMIMFSK